MPVAPDPGGSWFRLFLVGESSSFLHSASSRCQLRRRGTSSYKRPFPGFCLSSHAFVSVLRSVSCVLCQRFLADR